MSATFKIFGTLVLRSRKQLIVFGDLIEGDVARGMAFAPPDEPNAIAKVESIEYVELKSLGERHPGLVLHCDDAAQLDAWRERLREGVILSLK